MKSKFSKEKHKRYHLKQTIKLNGIYHLPPDTMHWEEVSITSVIFLPKIYDRNHKKTLNKLELSLKSNLQCYEVQRLTICSRSKRSKEVWQAHISYWIFICYKAHKWDNFQISIQSIDWKVLLHQLIFWGWFYWSYVTEFLVFSQYALKYLGIKKHHRYNLLLNELRKKYRSE